MVDNLYTVHILTVHSKERTDHMGKKARIFNGLQYEKSPSTGEDLHFDESNILSCVQHKTIKKWAYVLHDKDVYSEQDEADEKRKLRQLWEDNRYNYAEDTEEAFLEAHAHKKAGTSKPRHWHIVMTTDTALDVDKVAQWLGVPANMISIPKGGRRAFLDCVQYLTHESDREQEAGKHRYEDEEVKASFDFRAELDERERTRLLTGKDILTDKERLRFQVLKEGKTLRQVSDEHPLEYAADLSTLSKLRGEYLAREKPPLFRQTIYIYGQGGTGKTTLARLFAMSYFADATDEDDVIFFAGSPGSTFLGYDGQPVIIWDDRRAVTLLSELGGRDQFFRAFDTHPTKSAFDVKYGKVGLVNSINIVTGVEPYEKFLDGLAGEYTDKYGELHKAEDKSQVFRRVGVIVGISESQLDISINRGFFEGTRAFDQYVQYRRLTGNFSRVITSVKGDAQKVLTDRFVDPVKGAYDTLKDSEDDRRVDDIPEDMKYYGMTPIEVCHAEEKDAWDAYLQDHEDDTDEEKEAMKKRIAYEICDKEGIVPTEWYDGTEVYEEVDESELPFA